MILYILQYDLPKQGGWCTFDEFSSLNDAVKRAEYEGRKEHMEDIDFRLIKRTITEKEVLNDTFFKAKRRGL